MDKKTGMLKYDFKIRTDKELNERSAAVYAELDSRRSIREFSDRPVPREAIENIVMAASSAPSGAHKQPWSFCVVSDPAIKAEIRKAAEEEEYENYNGRMSKRWLEDLLPFGTDWKKPFLETAPYLIIVFKQVHEMKEDGSQGQNYYVNESVGIATGFLLSAIHQSGLASLTHTPSPMNFLQRILDRPSNERAYMLVPVGYPADDAQVPDIGRKDLDSVAKFY